MRQAVADVIEFMREFGQPIGEIPHKVDAGTIDLRLDLIEEESRELEKAMLDDDLPGVADACADLIYVTIGTAVAYGIDLAEVWRRVHAANMAKAGGPVREDGKKLKPPGWKPPDIEGALNGQTLMSNIYPLADRQARGVLGGSGDDR